MSAASEAAKGARFNHPQAVLEAHAGVTGKDRPDIGGTFGLAEPALQGPGRTVGRGPGDQGTGDHDAGRSPVVPEYLLARASAAPY